MAQVLAESIKYAGEFDFKKLISAMVSWLSDANFEYHESDYIQKDNELEIEYKAERKRNEWFMDTITVHYHFWGIKVIRGSSLESEHVLDARLQIDFKIGYETGYEGMFGKSHFRSNKFKEWVFEVLQKTILKYDLKANYEDSGYRLGRSIINHMKESLGMEMGLTRWEGPMNG